MLTTSPGTSDSSVGWRPCGAALSGSSAPCRARFSRLNMRCLSVGRDRGVLGVYLRPIDREPPIPLLPLGGLTAPLLGLPVSAPLEPPLLSAPLDPAPVPPDEVPAPPDGVYAC